MEQFRVEALGTEITDYKELTLVANVRARVGDRTTCSAPPPAWRRRASSRMSSSGCAFRFHRTTRPRRDADGRSGADTSLSEAMRSGSVRGAVSESASPGSVPGPRSHWTPCYAGVDRQNKLPFRHRRYLRFWQLASRRGENGPYWDDFKLATPAIRVRPRVSGRRGERVRFRDANRADQAGAEASGAAPLFGPRARLIEVETRIAASVELAGGLLEALPGSRL